MFISKTRFLIGKMNTSFICRSTIAFPYCKNDSFCVSMIEKRLSCPIWKMTFPIRKKLRIREKIRICTTDSTLCTGDAATMHCRLCQYALQALHERLDPVSFSREIQGICRSFSSQNRWISRKNQRGGVLQVQIFL